ncbi:MAG TPA: DNA cytosine methyltransferase [Lachnoclostridium phytofermentans]|uniref:Cytosine-specific methyltransferase n=1 Tax=Lachnoclostridium phytofermentans TaxID=66219 RepID=A0A3D2X8Y1_9FIRM|nr:DNA cytosine methyltransferase [Lachnoclostridium sp.]HCL02985.1 DNA cytosine methyltransferase [Lachnoclostridium phytofermentans]
MRVADFFCGGGGFSEGFRQAGFQIVFAVDKWEPAVASYKGNKPGVNAILDDVIRISLLDDEEFESIVPDSEVIIGSPPCQSFSHSNKSGNADKTLGIKLIEAYLRIIARKKNKPNSSLKYWVLENVPNVRNYIREEYTAANLGLEGNFVLRPHDGASGIYNAKYFGAPTNRERYLCGEFPSLTPTHTDENVVTLNDVLQALGDPANEESDVITDVNYPDLRLHRNQVSDHHYIYELAQFEIETARRLKQDKGYMGKMSFPENLDKPSRTVMATMSASSREAMILGWRDGKYRLPTVREVATMMGFPIDYRFYGCSKGIKHTLVGNAVSPKLSYAIAKAILQDSGEVVPEHYIPIHYDNNIPFHNLNGTIFELKKEKKKRLKAKFKYHIPYMIINAYRVELTNYLSDFERQSFEWNAEIHYSQGKARAAQYSPLFSIDVFPDMYQSEIMCFIEAENEKLDTSYGFQIAFCMTQEERKKANIMGPYELLNDVKQFIVKHISEEDMNRNVEIPGHSLQIPFAICMGYFILNSVMNRLGRKG